MEYVHAFEVFKETDPDVFDRDVGAVEPEHGQRYEKFANSVPEFLPGVEVALARPRDDLLQPLHPAAHDEDAEDACDVALHPRPVVPLVDLPAHQVVDVEVGACLEEALGGVLHLDEHIVPLLGGAEQVEGDAPLVSGGRGRLYVLELDVRDSVHLPLEDGIEEGQHDDLVLHAELEPEVGF